VLTERHPGIVITMVAGMRRLCFPHLSETGFQVLGGQEQLSCTPGRLPWFYPEYAWVFWEMVCIFPTGAISTDEGGRCSKWSARRWKYGRRRSWPWVEVFAAPGPGSGSPCVQTRSIPQGCPPSPARVSAATIPARTCPPWRRIPRLGRSVAVDRGGRSRQAGQSGEAHVFII
jgi:hypothetical protein